jgi:hypothetical protein
MLKEIGADDGGVVANYALAAELCGDPALADRLMAAALFYAQYTSSKHNLSIVRFNEALIKLTRGDFAGGRTALVDAARLRREEIAKYLGFSIVVRNLRDTPAAAEALVLPAESV